MIQSKLELGVAEAKGPFTLACSEQPQVRIENLGAAALSDTELLAVCLRNGPADSELMDVAQHMIAEAGSLGAMANWQLVDYVRWPGVGPGRATLLLAVAEIARRMARPVTAEAPVLNRPELVAAHMDTLIRGLEVEKFWVLCLNRKNRLKKMCEVTSGTATSSLAHPREVFRCAIRESAAAVVCVHNHPSGDPAPSAADVQVTRQLRDAAKAVDIELLDHIVLGRASADPQGRGFYSFREAGVL